MYERVLPYAIEIRDVDFDSEISDPPDPMIWHAVIYTIDGFCVHDINKPYELRNDMFIKVATMGVRTEKIDDHITTYLYNDEYPPLDGWDGYTSRLLNLFNILDPPKKV